MTLTLAQADRQAELTAYGTQFGAAAYLAIHSGSAPTDADTALSSNPICGALPFSATPFGAPSAAKPSVMTANALTQTNAYATVTATFYRCYAQGTAGITGSSFVVGNVYCIQAMGSSTTANWQSIGLPGTVVTATTGMLFVATGTTLTGSGTAYLMNVIEQGIVGTSGQDLNLNTTSIVTGGPIAVTSFTRQM